jgi:hypothetical protein
MSYIGAWILFKKRKEKERKGKNLHWLWTQYSAAKSEFHNPTPSASHHLQFQAVCNSF